MANLAPEWNSRLQPSNVSQHTVVFFDSDDHRLQTIYDFVASSLAEGAQTVVITPAQFHPQIRLEAENKGLPIQFLEIFDSTHLMCQLLLKKEINLSRFDSVIRPQILRTIQTTQGPRRPLRIYGDIVNGLCELGYDKAAIQLETIWHDLMTSLPRSTDFLLVCGYLIENFASATKTEAFEKICHLHHEVLPHTNESQNHSKVETGYLQAKIRQQNRAIHFEIEEQERLKAMNELSATVSHELANPLTTLLYSIERLEKWMHEQSLSEEQIEFLQNHLGRARRSSNKLNEVNRNVLNLYRANVNTSETFLLQSCIESTTSQIAFRILEQGIQLQVDIPDSKTSPIFVNGSRTSIEQVLMNLLTNATDSINERLSRKINTSTGKISIAIGWNSKSEVYIEIKDNGIGVPVDAKDRIFQSFFTTKPIGKGTGIGLTFSQKVVRKHGGDIEHIDSTEPGACFRVKLPTVARTD